MLDTIKGFLFHLDEALGPLASDLGFWIYILLFLIIFLETGIILMAFLPGDTLLFAMGILAAEPELSINIYILNVLVIAAAVTGNLTNYYIGHRFGRKMIRSGKIPFVKSKSIESAEDFYNKYGSTAVIISRFLAYIRSFIPFVAGIGRMNLRRYVLYSMVGAVLWSTSLTLIGYYLGEIPLVREHLGQFITVLIILPLLPIVVAVLKKWLSKHS